MSKTASTGLVALIIAAALTHTREADACGGCFTQSESATQVTGHRMILSLSNEQTTLYDQFEYAGDPASFAWVLPIKGQAEVGLSAEATFNLFDQWTAVTIQSPHVSCGGGTCSTASSVAGGGTTGDTEEVTVLDQEVVGPYETVQLSSQDPTALSSWLDSHGYQIPSEIQPVVQSYVDDGFDFLAIKLVPGTGVDAMRPVRVSTDGANPTLPLRMVAAGTGALTTLTLFVISEGRYAPANFPHFTIDGSQLTWDFDEGRSDYREVRQGLFETHDNAAFQIESALPLSKADAIEAVNTRTQNPDAPGAGYDSTAERDADMEAMFASLAETVVVTRMRGELSQAALAQDLVLEAASEQTMLDNVLFVDDYTGDPCSGSGSSRGGCSTSSTGSGSGGFSSSGHGDAEAARSSGCAAAPLARTSMGLGGLWLFAATTMALGRRRRARGRTRR